MRVLVVIDTLGYGAPGMPKFEEAMANMAACKSASPHKLIKYAIAELYHFAT